MATDQSTPTSYLQLLAEHRRFILLCEIGAFLHDLDKLSSAFFQQHTKGSSPYMLDIDGKRQKYIHGLDPNGRKAYLTHLLASDDFLSTFEQLTINIPDILARQMEKQFDHPTSGQTILLTEDPCSLSEAFLTHHDGYRQSKKSRSIPIPGAFVNGGLCGADGLDSEVDKSVAGDEQQAGSAYIASPFGQETSRLTAENLDDAKKKLLKEVTEILKKPSLRVVRQVLYEESGKSQKAMSQGLGETRRATNDVLLYDHSFSVATLTKAIAAKVLIEASQTSSGFYKLPLRYRGGSSFRILSIMANTPAILARGMRIGDILGYRDRLKSLRLRLQWAFEVDFPLGNVVYEDEYGVHLAVPAIEEKYRRGFEQEVRAQIDTILQSFASDDFEIFTHFSENPTQLLTVIAQQRQAGLDSFHLPSTATRSRLTWIRDWSRNVGINTDLCVVCRRRPKKLKETRCQACLWRYRGRARKWLARMRAHRQLSDNATVWLGEVADDENHVALVTAQLDLRRWLSGEFVSTMLAEPPSSESALESVRSKRQKAIRELVDQSLISEPIGIFGSAAIEKDTLTALKKDVGEANCVREFITQNLRERNLDGVDETDWSKALFFASIKKHPSGGRLRRIKEDCHKFWEDCQNHFLSHPDLWSGEHNLWRTKRLRFSPDQTLKDKLVGSSFSAFDMQAGRKKLAVVFDGKYLLSIDNLEREFKRDFPRDFSFEQLVAQLRQQLPFPVRLERTDRDGDQRERRDSEGNIVNVEEDGHDYIPIIPILLYPTVLQFIAPAVSVPDMVQHIQQQYEEHFGKVRNRLPLHIGVVAFKQRFPLYQAMNTAERMMQALQERSDRTWKEKSWNVVSNELLGKAMSLTLQTDQDDRRVNWKIDVTLGGGQVPDEFYPYVQVNQEAETLEQEKRKFFHARVEDKWSNWVHVKDLKPGDQVKVTPSFFDFQYLDSSQRRFEVGQQRRHLILDKKGPRPYYLEEFADLQRVWKLANNNLKGQAQFKNMLALLEERIDLWRNMDEKEGRQVLADFARDIIRQSQGFGQDLSPQDVDFLEKAFCLGWIFDADELFRLIGGQKIKGKNSQRGADSYAETPRHVA